MVPPTPKSSRCIRLSSKRDSAVTNCLWLSRPTPEIPPDAGNNVFLYWSGHGRSLNHGGANEFQWRDKAHHQGVTAQLLHETVTMMQHDKSFRKLLIVAEPCYAECVVSDLDGIPGVLAMTGANAQEQERPFHAELCDSHHRGSHHHLSRPLPLLCPAHARLPCPCGQCRPLRQPLPLRSRRVREEIEESKINLYICKLFKYNLKTIQ